MSGGLVVRGRPISVRYVDGHRFSVSIRDHELAVDQPRGSGGTDAGPSPTELFVAALVACVAHYGHAFLARHGVGGEVRAVVEWSVDLGAERVSRASILVEAPEVPAELAGGFRVALEHCLVHNTLREPPDVTIEVEPAERRAAG